MSKYILSALVVILVLSLGCSDRGENTAPVYDANGGVLIANHVFFWELLTQIRNKDSHLLYMRAWVPNVQEWTTNVSYVPDQKLPLLVLLPPENADDFYYFHHGLAQVANQLMAEGLLEPMAIFVPRNDPVYGGYWWASPFGSSPNYDTVGGGAGNYDAIVGGSLVDWIFARGLGTQRPFDESQGMTGIGGIGTGAYGAVRAALKHPGRFGSISTISGPMDFDGLDGQSGIIPLFAKAIAEQAGEPFATRWDTSSQCPISRLLTGAAMAFSPHDTLVLPRVAFSPTLGPQITCPDSIIFRIDTIPGPPRIIDTTYTQRRWKIQGTQTLLDSLTGDGEFLFHAHMPFDATGQPFSVANEPIWDLWLKNSLDRMLLAAERQGRVFENTDIWVAYSADEDPLGYNKMTMGFAKTLQERFSYEPEVYFYSGYEGNPAWGDEYLTHLLREMLVFHSNSFRRAREAQQDGK